MVFGVGTDLRSTGVMQVTSVITSCRERDVYSMYDTVSGSEGVGYYVSRYRGPSHPATRGGKNKTIGVFL